MKGLSWLDHIISVEAINLLVLYSPQKEHFPNHRKLLSQRCALEACECSAGTHLWLGSVHLKGEPWVIWHRSESFFLQHAVQQKVKVSERREFQLCWGKRHHDHFIKLQILKAIMLCSHLKYTILKKVHFQRLLHMPDKSVIHQLLYIKGNKYVKPNKRPPN